jgi:hypothetical protein
MNTMQPLNIVLPREAMPPVSSGIDSSAPILLRFLHEWEEGKC